MSEVMAPCRLWDPMSLSVCSSSFAGLLLSQDLPVWSKPKVPLPQHPHCINSRYAPIFDLRNVVDGLLRDSSSMKPRYARVTCAGWERGRAHVQKSHLGTGSG